MTPSTPSQTTVLEVFTTLAPAGAPLTTPEVAEEFDCTNRTIYNKLDALVDDGPLKTKKVGARGRVWWQPPRECTQDDMSEPISSLEGATGRKQTDEDVSRTRPDLERQIRIYETMLSSISDFAYLFDRDGRFLYVNQPLLDLWGLELEDAVGKNFHELPYPDELATTLQQQIQHVVETRQEVTDETAYTSPTGASGYYEYIFAPVFNADGAVEAVAGSTRDITERRRAEEALRESEQRYRTLFESMTEGFCVIEKVDTDPSKPINFRYVEANPAFTEQFGVDDVVGKTIREAVPGVSEDWFDIYDTVMQTGEAVRFERELVTEGRILELHAFQVGDKQNDRLGVLFTDITERKQTENALRESEERYRRLFEEMDEGVLLADVAFDRDDQPIDILYREANPAAAEILGEDFEGRWLTEIDPAYGSHLYEIFSRVANTGDGERHEMYLKPDEAWYDLYVFKPENVGSRRIAVIFQNITERKQTQQHLAQERDMFAEGPAVVFRWDPNAGEGWPVEYVSENVEKLLGYSSEELTAGDITYSDLLLNEEIERIATEVEENSEGMTERFSHDPYRIRTKDGDIRWVKDTTKIIRDDTGDITHYLGYLIDITERKQTRNALERLNTASRELMEIDTQGIMDRTTELTESVLGVEYTALWSYDETSGEFRQYTRSTAQETDPDVIRLPDRFTEQVWQTFISNDIDVTTDFSASENSPSKSSLQSCILLPLGRHGVLCAGSTQERMFDETTVDLTRTLGATIEAAWDRAEGEQQLARQNEELARLDRLNNIIREIDQALVQANTVEEIDRAVCERLAESDQYEFAWIGEHSSATDTITPREWAGVDSSYIDELEIPIDTTSSERNPIATAVHTQDPQLVSDIATETRFAPLREATLERGIRSCISVPLIYEESLYGVLTVYADHPQSDERNHIVLAELGRTIAHALNAVETRETLQTDRVVELTLQCRAPTTPLCRLARQTECTVTFEGLVHYGESEPDVFFTARDVSSETLQTASKQFVAIDELLCIDERDEESLFRMRASDPTLSALFVEQGAVVRTFTIEKGTATAVTDLSHTADVREFIERMQQTIPRIDLLGRKTRDRALKTRRTFRMICEERLTAKQQAALQTAYLSGFFESPRLQTGKEVAALLDISQPTFTNHLRAAQRGICDVLFEEQSLADG